MGKVGKIKRGKEFFCKMTGLFQDFTFFYNCRINLKLRKHGKSI